MSTPLITMERAITDIASKADYLVAVYFYSHDKQSVLTPELVLSLPSRMAAMGSDHMRLANQIEADLTVLLEGYFDAVQVSCETAREGESYKINASVNVIEGGKNYSLATLLTTEGKLVKEIVRVTSEGKRTPFRVW